MIRLFTLLLLDVANYIFFALYLVIEFAVGWQDLKDLFRGAGSVQRANIIQGRDGRSKGHGIVLFATVEDAKKAIEMYDKYSWHGRILEVREDRNLPDFAPPQPVNASAAIAASSEDVDKLVEAVEKHLTVADADQVGASTSAEDGKPANATSASAASTGHEGVAAADSSAKEGAEGTSVHSSNNPPVRPVFVANIPFRMRWQDLKDLFRRAGQVVRAEVALGPDRRSRGHGTVLFSTQEEADKAIAMFDQYQWHDRILHVQEDRMRQDGHGHSEGSGFNQGFRPNFIPHGPPGPFFRGPPPVNQNLIGRQVFVGNLPFLCQWQDLKDLFRKAGNIIRADVVHDFNGRSRGFGSVLFATQEDAKNAIEMFDNYEYNGRTLRVHLDKFTSVPHAPPMHGGVVPHMMRPNGPPPHHPHPHHPHHRMHPMHPQPGPGFLGTFGPPGLMNLGPHPMVHSGSPQGQFGMPPPQFPGRPYSPPMMMHGPAGSGPEFMGTEGFHRSESMPPMGEMAKSPPTFDPTSNVPVSADAHGGGGTSGPAISGPGGIPAHPGSPSLQQYPFLPNLGPIGKPNISNGGVGSAGLGPNGASVNGTGDDSGHVEYPPMQGYGVDVPYDADGTNAYSPHFYMYPNLLQNPPNHPTQHQHQHQGPPQGQNQGTGQQQQELQSPASPPQPPGPAIPPPGVTVGPSGGPSPVIPPFQPQRGSVYGGGGPYQDHPYSPDPTGLSPQPFSGSIGTLPGVTTAGGAAGVGVTGGGMSGRGYPTQPDWMGPPAPFGMGHYPHHLHHPPQPMYGSPSTFAPYGQGNGSHGNQDASEFTEA
ncbi:hypothetical protein BGZ73_008166 [Actinomortierella ambigua]|nr:hypothetical protein BGZ73_008166 [Actinomortierella ambigua]